MQRSARKTESHNVIEWNMVEKMQTTTGITLGDDARIAVIGGGPAGSFFSYFVLDMAARLGIKIHVDIFEPRDFDIAGPAGCNMCAGVLHESLVQTLAVEGISLPTTVVQRAMDSNMLHMGEGNVRIETPRHEKRIAATFRGIGPRDLREVKRGSLDGYLLSLAVSKGAHHIRARVQEAERTAELDPWDRLLQIKASDGTSRTYDLVAVTTGVNTAMLNLLQKVEPAYQPPRTTQCIVREYNLGQEAVTKYIGTSMHAFLLNIPRLDLAALIPKGDYVTLALIGHGIDKGLLQTLVNHPAVTSCLPPNFPLDQVSCWCAPRINVGGSRRPYGDRIVFIGDSGVSRLYKDGIGAAYRAAKVAATTVIFKGIATEDFERHYGRFCRAMEVDNWFAKVIFTIVHQIQKVPFARRAVLHMVSAEQQGKASAERGMSMVMWDMFTGSESYRDTFMRTLHPIFWTRFLWSLVVSILPPSKAGALFQLHQETLS